MAGKSYENNPFLIALDGINIVFEKAKGPAILLIVVSIISAFSGFTPGYESPDDQRPAHEMAQQMQTQLASLTAIQWATAIAIIVILIASAIFISSMISGISAYTSARLARGHKVTISEAFHAVLDRFFSYIWLQILIGVKILLWSLLFIIPGIIMAVRYSLASVAFFDKGLKGNDAIKESLSLTKGGWLTTFASLSLFNLITLGVIAELVNSGARVVLYRQFSELHGKKDKKPAAHLLSWITLALPFVFIGLILMLVVMLVTLAAVTGMM